MTTFLDTNILIYLLDSQDAYHSWSVQQLNTRKQVGPMIISDIVYCEFAVGMPTQAAVDAAVAHFALERMTTDDAVLFRAAAAFKQHRAQKGTRTTVLPDFLIGALAEAVGAPLLTNNARDFAPYFPSLQLIKP
jgi:predicted nucleic acid-binding protein